MKYKNGFTLIEVLIVIGIAAVIFTFSAPYAMNFYRSNLLNDAQSNVIDALQRARHYALLQKNDSNFGVHIATSTYTLFQGTTYVPSNINNEVFPLVNGLTFSTSTDIIFSKLTGSLTDPATMAGTTSLNYGSISKGVFLSDVGTISKVDTVAPVVETPVTTPSPSIPTAGLVASWSFDGNALDSTSNHYNGTCSGGSCPTLTTGVKNTPNTAYSFSNSSLDVGSTLLGTDQDEITVTAWIKYTGSLQPGNFFLDKTSSGSAYPLELQLTSAGKIMWLSGNNNGHAFSNLTGSTPLSSDTWYFVAFVGNATSKNIYLNNNVSAEAVENKWGGVTVDGGVSNLWIGKRGDNTYPFNGSIDNVHIYNRALSQPEVSAIYNEEKP